MLDLYYHFYLKHLVIIKNNSKYDPIETMRFHKKNKVNPFEFGFIWYISQPNSEKIR